ncbi:MAG: hypothetical protein QXL31_05995 [Thermosphaera sp.]
MNAIDLTRDKYVLPIGDLRVRFLIDGRDPIPNAEAALIMDGVAFKSRTNAMGGGGLREHPGPEDV